MKFTHLIRVDVFSLFKRNGSGLFHFCYHSLKASSIVGIPTLMKLSILCAPNAHS